MPPAPHQSAHTYMLVRHVTLWVFFVLLSEIHSHIHNGDTLTLGDINILCCHSRSD
uniref:Uncharacterized protein n=1 Tax=Ciona intestinalis TaxID=7719 RepID=F6UYR3_CIOIN